MLRKIITSISESVLALLFAIAVAALSVALWNSLLLRPVLAHDREHPENNEWLRQLASGRGPCCDGSDAVRVDDPDWTVAEDGRFTIVKDGRPQMVECRRNTNTGWQENVGEENSHGHYCVRLKVHPEQAADNEYDWFFVPDHAVVSYSGEGEAKHGVPNQDGQVRVWPMTSSLDGGIVTVFGVRCFLPGVQG